MNIYDEPKIDCHNHILDPARFPSMRKMRTMIQRLNAQARAPSRIPEVVHPSSSAKACACDAIRAGAFNAPNPS